MRFECWDCKTTIDADIAEPQCSRCGSLWIEPLCDYPALAEKAKRIFDGTVGSLWKYLDLLPISSSESIVSFGEGGTPLVKAKRLGKRYGIDLYIKDEGCQPPTFTFKNRGGTLAVSGLKQEGRTKVALYSTGNIGVAFAHYCKKAGIELFIFCPNDTPQDKIDEMQAGGAHVQRSRGTYADAMDECKAFASEHRIYMDKGAKSIYRRASKKTVAFEVYEQLGCRAPAWYFQSVSGGLGPLGFYVAFTELAKMGLTKRMPSIGCVQVDGCNPMYQSFIRNTEEITKIERPLTEMVTLATGKPMSYPYVYRVVKATAGRIESVPEKRCYDMAKMIFDEEGVVSHPASAAALVGIAQLAEQGFFGKCDGPVVFASTGRK